VAQTVQKKSQVDLKLVGERQVVQRDAQGKEQVTWQALANNTVVQPGNVVRYTVKGTNTSDRPVTNLVVTQPVPQGTTFVLNSASFSIGKGTMTYSIDSGKTYVASPTIQVKLPDGKVETRPAPAERYTNIRWTINQPIAPKQGVSGSYQVRVR
jgi:uncharacterized repeat protein (TIGR01451 family)